MEMKMLNRLTGILSAIGHNAVPPCKPLLSGDRRNCPKAGCELCVRNPADLIQRTDMCFRNNQNMDRCLRIDVPERKDIFVFVDNGGGDFTFDAFTEETVLHKLSFLSYYNPSAHCAEITF